MNWSIVPQEESVGFGEKRIVDCKHIKFFPIAGKSGKVDGFGRLKTTCFKVLLAHNQTNAEVTVNLSIRANGDQVYSVVNPSKLVPKMIRINGRMVEDRLSPKVVKPGDKHSFSRTMFLSYMRERFGEEVALAVLFAFAKRVNEMVPAKAA